MKYRALFRRYGKPRRKGGAPTPVLVHDIVCDTPAGYRWFKRMAAESGFGHEVEGGGWLLNDEPDNLPRFWETLAAAGGELIR